MKREYSKPQFIVSELDNESLLMANSIPGGGEIDMGGRAPLDAPSLRNNLWDDYEK
jgi:hypothetical protein